MNWKVLQTEDEYSKASLRLMTIFHAKPNTPEYQEMQLLIILVKDYDDRYYQIDRIL